MANVPTSASPSPRRVVITQSEPTIRPRASTAVVAELWLRPTGGDPFAAALLIRSSSLSQGRARGFLQALEGGASGLNFTRMVSKAIAEAAVAQFASAGRSPPAPAVVPTLHRPCPVGFRPQGSQGRNRSGWGHGRPGWAKPISKHSQRRTWFRVIARAAAKFASVTAPRTRTPCAKPPGQASAMAGVARRRWRRARAHDSCAFPALAPAAVVGQQACASFPLIAGRGPGDRADRQVSSRSDDCFNLAGHRRPSGSRKKWPSVSRCSTARLASAKASCRGGAKNLPAHQQAAALLKRHQARQRGVGQPGQPNVAAAAQLQQSSPLDDCDPAAAVACAAGGSLGAPARSFTWARVSASRTGAGVGGRSG